MSDVLVRAIGFRGLALHSDPLGHDRLRWVARKLPTNLNGLRVLDAGCGNGAFAMLAARRGATVTALSDSERDLEAARRRAAVLGIEHVTFEVQDLRTLPQRTDLMDQDIVFCLEVIEHVLDDAALLAALGACTKSGGQLLLSTPTDDHPALYGEERHLSGVEDGRHVRWGSSRERLTDVLQASGWVPGPFTPISGPISRRITSFGYRVGERSTRLGWASTLPFRAATRLDGALLRSSGTVSHCWGVVARQPA